MESSLLGLVSLKHDWKPQRDSDCSEQKVEPGSTSLCLKSSRAASTLLQLDHGGKEEEGFPLKMNGKHCVFVTASDLV